MAEPSRYSVSDKDAGVQNGILKNKLKIKDQKIMDDAETILLGDTYTHFFELLEKGEIKFDFSLIFEIHRFFLNTLYSWAGKTRTIDISKDGMFFASVKYIDSSLKDFEQILRKNIPVEKDTKRRFAQKLAVIHNEYNAIHPFREGNGRAVRLFLDLLVVKFGYNPIDWSKKQKNKYIEACVKGMSQKNKQMEQIIYFGLYKQK